MFVLWLTVAIVCALNSFIKSIVWSLALKCDYVPSLSYIFGSPLQLSIPEPQCPYRLCDLVFLEHPLLPLPFSNFRNRPQCLIWWQSQDNLFSTMFSICMFPPVSLRMCSFIMCFLEWNSISKASKFCYLFCSCFRTINCYEPDTCFVYSFPLWMKSLVI